MSTSYVIYKGSDGSTIEVLEHSNVFDIDFFANSESQGVPLCKDITTDQLMSVGMEILKVVSYFNDSDDSISEIIQKKVKEFSIF